jgi:hypothetical protein
MKIHARIAMELELNDDTWKEIYNRIQSGDKVIASELFALFKTWGKVVDDWDSYIPGPWLAADTTGDEDTEGFDDIIF